MNVNHYFSKSQPGQSTINSHTDHSFSASCFPLSDLLITTDEANNNKLAAAATTNKFTEPQGWLDGILRLVHEIRSHHNDFYLGIGINNFQI
jgi:hypothetical protein